MIVAEVAVESAVPVVAGAETAAVVPEHEERLWPWKDAPIPTLVQRIHQLQAERAQAFRRLEKGHRQYLRSGPPHDFPSYRSTVHEVTQAFAAASREVLAVEAELAGPRAQPLLSSHVRSLQKLEQTRLATTLTPCLLQLCHQSLAETAALPTPRPHAAAPMSSSALKPRPAHSTTLPPEPF